MQGDEFITSMREGGNAETIHPNVKLHTYIENLARMGNDILELRRDSSIMDARRHIWMDMQNRGGMTCEHGWCASRVLVN